MKYEEVKQIMTVLLQSGWLTDEDSKMLCHLLINNPRYAEKLVLVTDGSYRDNRIWFCSYDAQLCVEYQRTLMGRDRVSLHGKSVKYKLNWLWNHYDTIYFQVPMYKSVKEVMHDRYFSSWMDASYWDTLDH